MEIDGGLGDDYIVGAFEAADVGNLLGGGGKDVIRTDYYDGTETWHAAPADQDQNMWGDYAYGPDADPFNVML